MIPAAQKLSVATASKPRASGDDPRFIHLSLSGSLVNPARAGMIRSRPSWLAPAPSKPRASGDDPFRYLQAPGRLK